MQDALYDVHDEYIRCHSSQIIDLIYNYTCDLQDVHNDLHNAHNLFSQDVQGVFKYYTKLGMLYTRFKSLRCDLQFVLKNLKTLRA